MDEKKKNQPTKLTLIIRILISAYILYLAWGLRTAPAEHTGIESIFFIAVMILFAVFSVVYGGHALLALKKGEYSNSDEEDED